MSFKDFVILSFLTTQFSEIVLINLILKFQKFFKTTFLIFLFNSFTHPIAIYLYIILGWKYFLVEGLVIFVESIFYDVFLNFSWKKSFLFSFLANIFSILTGLLIKTQLIKFFI